MASVRPARVKPVSRWVAVTVAPVTTPPPLSDTVPRMEPVVSCASTAEAPSSARAAA